MSLRFFGRNNNNNNNGGGGNTSSSSNNASGTGGPTGNVPMIDFREGALIDTPPVVVLPPDADTVRKLQEMSSRVEEIQRQNEELERKLAIRTKDLEKKINTSNSNNNSNNNTYPHAMMANAAAAAQYSQHQHHHHHNTASNNAKSQEVMQKIGMLETNALPALGRAIAAVGGRTNDDNDDDDAIGANPRHEERGRGPVIRKDRVDEWMRERVRLEQLRRARDRIMVGGGGEGGV